MKLIKSSQFSVNFVHFGRLLEPDTGAPLKFNQREKYLQETVNMHLRSQIMLA